MARSRRLSDRYADPLATGLVALVVYSIHGIHGILGRDQATFIYGGIRFAHGVPPYRGIFNSVGPLGDMVAGVGVRLGWLVGLDAILGARLIYLVLSVACVVALGVLAREALGTRVAGLLAPAVFLTFGSFLKLAGDGPREKTITVLCLEIALVLLLRRRWFGAGVLTALATLAWQPAILAGVAAVVAALVTTPRPRVRRAAAWAVGGLVPTAVLAGYFVVAGAARVAYWGFVEVNVGYTSQPDIVDSWHLLPPDYGWSLTLVVLGWCLAVAWFVAAVLGRVADPDRRRAHLVLGATAVVAGLWSCYAINGGPDLFFLLPLAAVAIAATVELAAHRVSARAVVRSCAVVAAVAVLAAGIESVATRDGQLAEQRTNATALLDALPAGSTVLSVSAPQVLVLMHRTNPYPWQLSNLAMSRFFDARLPGGLAGYSRRISQLRPALIAVGFAAEDYWVLPMLHRHYRRIGRGHHWTWYAARNLGRPTIQRLRAANDATWPQHQ